MYTREAELAHISLRTARYLATVVQTDRVSVLWDALQLAREQGLALKELPPEAAEAARRYCDRKQQDEHLRVDYADLPGWLLLHRSGPHTAEEAEAAASWLPPRLREAAAAPGAVPTQVLVDEAQDLSPIQLALIRALLPPDGSGFFGIGDPDQAIYGFRGAGGQSESVFQRYWPSLQVLRLGISYRASQAVLDMAQRLLQGHGHCGSLTAAQSQAAFLHLFAASDEQAEARWIARRAVALLGATSHSLLDAAQQTDLDGTLSPGDIAVLVRLRAQIPPIRAALEHAGIPCAAPESAPFWQDPLCAAVLRFLAVRHINPLSVCHDSRLIDQLRHRLCGNASCKLDRLKHPRITFYFIYSRIIHCPAHIDKSFLLLCRPLRG